MILTPHLGVDWLCAQNLHVHKATDPWCVESRPRGDLAEGHDVVNIYTKEEL